MLARRAALQFLIPFLLLLMAKSFVVNLATNPSYATLFQWENEGIQKVRQQDCWKFAAKASNMSVCRETSHPKSAECALIGSRFKTVFLRKAELAHQEKVKLENATLEIAASRASNYGCFHTSLPADRKIQRKHRT